MPSGGVRVCSASVVVTHAAPSFYELPDNKDFRLFCEGDKNLATGVATKRNRLAQLYQYLVEHGHPVASWFLGHYHHSGEQEHEHTRLRLLDIMELCDVDERVR